MYLSRTTDYALRALSFLSIKPEEALSVHVLQKKLDVPEKYLASIMTKLRNAGLISAIRGQRGGYRLTKTPEEVQILQVINLIEGEDAISTCFLGNASCNDDTPCLLHASIREHIEAIRSIVKGLSLADINQNCRITHPMGEES